MRETAQAATKSAVLSPCGAYRHLSRWRLGQGAKPATFIMLNPSTADAERDDATIRKCVGFARSWGCAGLQVVSLFALRTADPSAFNQDMAARGTPCIQPPREAAFGAKLAVYADPDGLPFSAAGSLKMEPADQGLAAGVLK